jgi:hypothetical protein
MQEARDRAYSFVDILNMNRDRHHKASMDADFDLMFCENPEFPETIEPEVASPI